MGIRQRIENFKQKLQHKALMWPFRLIYSQLPGGILNTDVEIHQRPGNTIRYVFFISHWNLSKHEMDVPEFLDVTQQIVEASIPNAEKVNLQRADAREGNEGLYTGMKIKLAINMEIHYEI